ncbi:MAG TPA: hypothetical protein VE868_09355 [Balneolaceae bacterium]|nr:hypothetical protein [Balneolaceae bacterium]
MLKILFTLILFYVLVKVISGLFLQESVDGNSNARFFYQVFKNVRDQQKNQKRNRKQSQNGDVKNRLDDIEEAEYEDITEESTESSRT